MQKILYVKFCSIIFIIMLGFSSSILTSYAEQDAPDEKSKKTEESAKNDQQAEAMEEKWMEFASPNENHEALGLMAGDWNYVVKFKMAPDSEFEESKGISRNKMIMGGRYLRQRVQGTTNGNPFQGMGYIGYDNAKKQYEAIWFDNLGTGFVIGTGSYDPKTKTFSEEGTFSNPFSGESKFRGVTKIFDDNNFTYDMYTAGPDGKEFLQMEISYSRIEEVKEKSQKEDKEGKE